MTSESEYERATKQRQKNPTTHDHCGLRLLGKMGTFSVALSQRPKWKRRVKNFQSPRTWQRDPRIPPASGTPPPCRGSPSQVRCGVSPDRMILKLYAYAFIRISIVSATISDFLITVKTNFMSIVLPEQTNEFQVKVYRLSTLLNPPPISVHAQRYNIVPMGARKMRVVTDIVRVLYRSPKLRGGTSNAFDSLLPNIGTI